jgi:hypothetical protein
MVVTSCSPSGWPAAGCGRKSVGVVALPVVLALLLGVAKVGELACVPVCETRAAGFSEAGPALLRGLDAGVSGGYPLLHLLLDVGRAGLGHDAPDPLSSWP